MTEKDIEKMLEECSGLDTSHLNKSDILAKAKQEMYFGSEAAEPKKEKSSFGLFFSKKRFIPILAGVALAFTLCVGTIGLYNENFQTLYIDVNPSVALKLNRFERVIGVEFLNDDAKALFANTNLVGCNASEALDTVLLACSTAGYVKSDSEIYISTTSKQEKDAEKLLEKLKGRAETMKQSSETYSVNTYNAKKNEKKNVEDFSLSPAKYKIITEILEKNAGYTFDELKNKPMGELHKILRDLGEDFDDLDDLDDDRNEPFEDDRDKRPSNGKKPPEYDRDDEDDEDEDDDRNEGYGNKKPSSNDRPEMNRDNEDDNDGERIHGENSKDREHDDD